MSADPLASAVWECTSTPPGEVTDAAELVQCTNRWVPAQVPGTAASAVWAADGVRAAMSIDYDEGDWWFKTTFGVPSGGEDQPWLMAFDGLATLADVWLNGAHLLHSENMFRRSEVEIDRLDVRNELVLRFAALAPELHQRRPRPRWRASLVREQNLRWFRTTLLGRMPGWAGYAAPVGPWRPISLRHRNEAYVVQRELTPTLVGADGVLDVVVDLWLPDGLEQRDAMLRVGEVEHPVVLRPRIHCVVTIPEPNLWWPHTHGASSRYRVSLAFDNTTIDLGAVGFRTIAADRALNGFALLVNGERIFVRGACWVPPDVVGLNADRAAIRQAVSVLRDGGLNMLRVTGTMVYESSDFFDACDELGMLVWHDIMLATLDPPMTPEFTSEIEAEVRDLCAALRARPSLAVICGGSESQQQPAYLGFPAADRTLGLVERVIPKIVADLLPGIPYVTSSPSGGDLPTRLNEGVSQYFGVGAYLRPLLDVKLAQVRFAAECLAFSIPPEKVTVDEVFDGPTRAGHDPRWKQTVPRDALASWDFEDVRDFYVRQIFDVDPMVVRYADPARALDLGRAAVAHVFETVFGHWRRADVDCAGALVLAGSDLWPGAGWGLVDAFGRPKAPWYVLRRLLAPVAVYVTDEGLDGLLVHVINDTASPITGGRLDIELFDLAGRRVAGESVGVDVDARSAINLSLATVFDGFRDVNHAFRFGPANYDALAARLVQSGVLVSDVVYLPRGQVRAQAPDIGLTAHARLDGDEWIIDIASERVAQWIAIDVAGYLAVDSWFHLPPGGSRSVRLRLDTHAPPREAIPRGYIRALNSLGEAAIVVDAGLMRRGESSS